MYASSLFMHTHTPNTCTVNTYHIYLYPTGYSLQLPVYKFPLVYLLFACNKPATAKIIAPVALSYRCRYIIPCVTHSTLYFASIIWSNGCFYIYCFACVRNFPLHDSDDDEDVDVDVDDEWYWEVSPFSKYTDFGHTVYREKQILSFVATFFSFVCSRCHRAALSIFICLFVCIKPIAAKYVEKTERRLCACRCVRLYLCLCVSAIRSVLCSLSKAIEYTSRSCISYFGFQSINIFVSPHLNYTHAIRT